MALKEIAKSASRALVPASSATEVGKLSTRLENLQERHRRARDKRALLDLERAEMALAAAEGDETASQAMQSHHAEDAALVQDIRTLSLAIGDVERKLVVAEERQRIELVKSANAEIRSLLKERRSRLRDMELAVDSMMNCLDELNRIGVDIRRIRRAHLGPRAASDHLTTTALHERLRRYMGRKLHRYMGLGFEKLHDGTVPAPWADWEKNWECDLHIPNGARSPIVFEKEEAA